MKILKNDSNFEIEVNAEEIAAIAVLLKNDAAMELVSGFLRHYQHVQRAKDSLETINLEREFNEIINKRYEEEEEEPEPKRNINASDAFEEGEKDPEYFLGVPNNGSKKLD